jgi:hypothetical protein
MLVEIWNNLHVWKVPWDTISRASMMLVKRCRFNAGAVCRNTM